MIEILTLAELIGWRPTLTPAIQERAVPAIEGGGPALYDPPRAPLSILERPTGKPLTAAP